MGTIKTITQRLFGRTVIDSLDLNQNGWYIDEEQVTATASKLNGSIAASNIHNVLALGTSPNDSVAVAGMLPSDYIVSVMKINFADPIIENVTSQYTCGTGYMNKTGGDDNGCYLMILWVTVV